MKRISEIARTIKRIAGMPDYSAYVEHIRLAHPDRPVPTEREFYDEFVERRYGNGTSRCC
ncbi:MAG: YbdD/YjiX family protein [Gemmatimonadota bacterium]